MQEPTAAALGEVQAAFGADPAAAMCLYKAKSTLQDGLCTKLSFPNTPEHGGPSWTSRRRCRAAKTRGRTPWAFVLAACQEISYKAFATVMGIEVKSVACRWRASSTHFSVLMNVPEGSRPRRHHRRRCLQERWTSSRAPWTPTAPVRFLSGTCADVDVKTQAPTRPRDDGSLAAQAEPARRWARTRRPPVHLQSVLKTGEGPRVVLTYPTRQHHGPYKADEPPAMPGGQNTGPNPMDLVWARRRRTRTSLTRPRRPWVSASKD